jgi:hypothetical protein
VHSGKCERSTQELTENLSADPDVLGPIALSSTDASSHHPAAEAGELPGIPVLLLVRIDGEVQHIDILSRRCLTTKNSKKPS